VARSFRSGANFNLADVGPDVGFEAVSMVAQDGAVSRGLLYRQHGTHPTVGVHLMHPRTDQSQNYTILPLARAGYLVLGHAGRWVNNDMTTVHERLLFDVAAGVRVLTDRGCEQVVLLGNSGGGTLAALYQAQARTCPPGRLTHTAAGDRIDLNGADLPAAAGLVLIGAHAGEAAALLKWIDPSVVSEHDPYTADPALDMYDEANGFRVPPESSRYDPEFLSTFRSAQRDRVARIDALARERVGRRREAAAAAAQARGKEQARLERTAAVRALLLIHRTMADPAFVDLSIEPDDRLVSAYNNDPRPDLVNYGGGVATVLTPEAWLSTWSGLSSGARTVDCLRAVGEPLLVVHYMGDVITRVSEAEEFLAAAGARDKQLVMIRHADHYGFTIHPDGTRRDRTAEGTDNVVAWMRERFPST
jgi:pimeloyl-ACP methyl ester carboxylesterase